VQERRSPGRRGRAAKTHRRGNGQTGCLRHRRRINRLPDGKLAGDVDFDAVRSVAGWITPVPGGVGPMTIAMLLENCIRAAAKE
jgi:hypothetical protein